MSRLSARISERRDSCAVGVAGGWGGAIALAEIEVEGLVWGGGLGGEDALGEGTWARGGGRGCLSGEERGWRPVTGVVLELVLVGR